VPKTSTYEVEMAVGNVRRHKSPDTDQIPAELIKARGRTICSEIHKLINSTWNKEKLPKKWKESIILIRRAIKHCSNY
jgi:hypothetical protein